MYQPQAVDTEHWTVAQARQHLIQNRKEGTRCLVCQRPAKIYRRVLNGTMSYVLILLYKQHKLCGPQWIHVVDFLGKVYLPNEEIRAKLVKGDWPKMRWWQLIIEKPGDQPDGNPCSGYWAITQAGIDFVEGKSKLAARVFEFRSQLMGWDTTKFVNIQQALKSKFNYAELMNS